MRRSGARVAVVMLMAALPSLAGCAWGEGGPAGSAPDGTASVAPAEPLSRTELEHAALAGTDLDGYDVAQAPTTTRAAHRTADPSACSPLVHAVGTGTAHAAGARVGRSLSMKKPGPGITLSLSTYTAEVASQVIGELRTAAKECEVFKDVQVDFRYDTVELRPDPGYGDESVSVRLTQLAAADENEKPVRVPCAVVAVRKGATVVMFSTYSNPSRPWGKGPAAVPDEVVTTQLDKLDKA
ncbi:hypothetical protein ACFVU0_21535 [Streptomyces sp. NPDC058122]|uniref:hypothetical protein n=1 Tax=Streptomyces sp. NPDC058122 TaxID=3346349 RepID=UPI0036DFC886